MRGTTVEHYRIEAQLGSGGMGTVYRAVDTRLGRTVALKFLRPELLDRPEALKRFKREARAISALNHPNICTLYDIGESRNGPFLTMEYVEGKTISEMLGRRRFGSEELLDIAFQLAEALDAAHSLGLVHRDIKPSNVMVTVRGQPKILDFGIAKERIGFLGQARSVDGGESETVSLLTDLTSDGSLAGTLPFIAPERIRGAAADARSDLFSLGATLYEMATGNRAFAGDTPAEVIVSLLERQPVSPRDLVPDLSPCLNEVIVTALDKDPRTRYQSAAEMRAALLRCKREQVPAPASTSKRSRRLAIAAAVLLAASVASIAVFRIARRNALPAYEHMTMSRLTSTGNVVAAAISPDGRYLAYAADENGRQTLRIRQVSTNSEVTVSAQPDAQYRRLSFSPDGDMLYYSISPARLYAVPALGGTPKLLNSDVDSAVSFSPDGKSITFQRRYVKAQESSILIAQADGTGERRVATRKLPAYFNGGVSWSPDGKTLACTAGAYGAAGQFSSLVAIPAAGGAEKVITNTKWYMTADPRWLKHGHGVIIQAADKAFSPAQIWYVPYPKGEARRITNDLNNYTGVALTADSSAFVTVQLERISNIWVGGVDEKSRPVQVTSGGAALDGFTGLSWTPDGRVAYGSRSGGDFDIWIMNSDGTNRVQLTRNSGVNAQPDVSPDGRFIVFTSDRSTAKPHIWRMDLNGDHARQLTDGNGEHVPNCCIDGKWVVFGGLGAAQLSKAPIDGGPSEPILRGMARVPIISPDSIHVAFNYFGEAEPPTRGVAVMDAHAGRIEKRFPIRNDDPSEPHVGLRPMAWRVDSRALFFLRDDRGVSNIWVQPLASTEPVQWSHYEDGRIFWFGMSRDGHRIALAKGSVTSDVILVKDRR